LIGMGAAPGPNFSSPFGRAITLRGVAPFAAAAHVDGGDDQAARVSRLGTGTLDEPRGLAGCHSQQRVSFDP